MLLSLKRMIIGSCTIFLAGCGTSNPSIESTISNPSTEQITIFALGDSITAGYQLPPEQSWPSQLQQLLISAGYKNYTVVNAGKSGDTSKQLKDRLDRSTSEAKPGDIAIVTIGGNDGFQSVPVTTLENNIRDIVQSLQARGLTVVLGGMQITTNLGQQYISEFRKIYPKIAKENSITLIPFILEGVALNPSLNLTDMIHPNEAGYAIMATTVFNHLQSNNIINQ